MSAPTDVECVLLTGGSSRRMGRDKASIVLDGVRADESLCRRMVGAGYPVTVAGREMVAGCRFVPDREEFRGPAVALAALSVEAPYVFVLACDVFGFDPSFIALARAAVEGHDAVAPIVDGYRQPLCALYRSECLTVLRECVAEGDLRLQRWLARLIVRELAPADIADAGLNPLCVRGANSPEELRELLGPNMRDP